MVDREVTKLIEKGIASLDRLANGVEKLIDEPMIELEESTPLRCPYCNAINPGISLPATEAMQGRISEFVLTGTCTSCNNEIFSVSSMWSIYGDKERAIESLTLLLERVYGNGRASHAGKN